MKETGVGTMVFQTELGYEVDLGALYQANQMVDDNRDRDREMEMLRLVQAHARAQGMPQENVQTPLEIPKLHGTQYNSEVTPRLTTRFLNTKAILNIYQSGKLNIVGMLYEYTVQYSRLRLANNYL